MNIIMFYISTCIPELRRLQSVSIFPKDFPFSVYSVGILLFQASIYFKF